MNCFRLILLIIFSIYKFTFSQEKVNFKQFGAIIIDNRGLSIGKKQWTCIITTKDSSYIKQKNTTENDRLIYFIFPEDFMKDEEFFFPEEKVRVVILKNKKKEIFNQEHFFSYQPEAKYQLKRTEIKERKKIKGDIVDAYLLESINNYYTIIRSELNNFLFCWYLLKNNKIINIHTERIGEQIKFLKPITLTDLNEDGEPEINFLVENVKGRKCIQMNGTMKSIIRMENKKMSYTFSLKDPHSIEKKAFLTYQLKQKK